jgi:asparagine synthase (glutamine-hydrolysing)
MLPLSTFSHGYIRCTDSSGRFALLFDGRLDNREELGAGPGESDAEVALRLLAGGWEALDRLIGPWALVLLDLQEREVHLARDPTGERMLCWHATPAEIRIAGDPAALPAPRDPDESTLAAFFTLREPEPDATFFRAVKQVPAGCRVTFPGGRTASFWRPDLSLLRGGEAESVERFRELVTTAVRAQLRDAGPAAVLMSGGLDSTTVAAHAARLTQVRAVSWRFRELSGADESAFAEAMMAAAGLEPVWVEGDGCWPLRDFDERDVDPGLPFENPYRELHAAAFSAAAAGGSRVLLTGHFSDEMYHGVDAWWLRDALACGDRETARQGLRDELRWGRRPDVWTPGLARTLGAAVLGSGWERLRALRDRRRLPPLPARHPEQAQTLLSPFALMGIAVEMRRARQRGIELRFPFRDRRLLEFALRLPAHHLARPGWRKRLVWLAAEGWLPDAVRLRRRMSDLGPLFARGIGEREHETVRRLLFGPGPGLWRRWVDAAKLERFLHTARTGGSGVSTLIFWRCVAAEIWARRLLQ